MCESAAARVFMCVLYMCAINTSPSRTHIWIVLVSEGSH